MTARHHAMLLAGIAVLFGIVAVLAPAMREAAVVVGLFFLFLAGGVLNWDRRGGH
ncbi:MAG: hypothetical protein HY332_00120 [Chloroflexi bacterium]|nr:hypothetical protein [Chloroflexota bacterium]